MKFTLAFFFFLFQLCSISLAQKADSLYVVLGKTKADSTKTLLLSLLADELTATNPQKAFETARNGLSLAKQIGFKKGIFENYLSLAVAWQGQAFFDSAVFYYHQAYDIAELREDIAGQAEVCSGLGHSFMRKSALDSSRYYLEKGLTLSKAIKDYRIEAGIYNNYGNVFLEEHNYQKALDYFIQAAKLYENPLADDYGQCLALSNIGNIEYRLGNYDKALDYARQSMTIARREKLTSSVGYAHKLLGRIYRKQENYDLALEEYRQAQKLYLTLGDTRSVAEILQNIGNIYFDRLQHRDALANYIESLRMSKIISVKPLIAHAYSAIGQSYVELKKHDEALLYLDSSRVVAQAIGNKYLVMDNYAAMSSTYEAKGDYKKALAIHQQFVQVKDSITQSENRALAEETQAKYELEKRTARITLLEKDKELKNLELERLRVIQASTAIALVLFMVIGILLVNRFRVSNKVKRLAEIERVRNSLARDLHDDIGSTLSTINIISKLAMIENPNGNSLHLKRISDQSSRMMESMNDMVWSINPVNDSIEKVMVRMKVFCGEILEPKNINYQFSGEESLNGLVLNADKRKNLFLVFKEAINNAAKYSGATAIEVTLKQSDGNLVMTVSDNGNGFDELHVNGGNGLHNMQARARSMNAKFKLASTISKGTHIEVVLPVT
jgi:two-component system, NarL family, sensor histidine kinase UhpB